MNRKYSWTSHEELRKAVQYVLDGDSFHKAYKKTGVSPGTIKKFYYLYVHNPKALKKVYNNAKSIPVEYDKEIDIFTPEQEEALLKCFKEFECLFYGLTEKECCMLAYQMVVSEDMKIPAGWKYGMASLPWLVSFQHRHFDFVSSINKPNRLCARLRSNRAQMPEDRNTIWEKKTVNNFYDDLEGLIHKWPELMENKRIYSLDEAYTNINPERMIVNRINRSNLLTTCLLICADGTSIPPIVIIPHLPFDKCSVVPPGAVVLIGSLGRMNADIFTEVMHHFVKHSNSSLTNPCILIMDTDLCHLSYAALTLAKESGVHIVTLHPHVTSLIQPLYGEILDQYHNTYNDAMETWWDEQGDMHVACDFGRFVCEGFSKAMTPENIQNGFKKCGISPFDRDLFVDDDYVACLDAIEATCVECRLRDNRSKPEEKKSNDSEEKVEVEDNAGEAEETAPDIEEANQSEEVKEGQKVRSDTMTDEAQSKNKGSTVWTDYDIEQAYTFIQRGYNITDIAKRIGIPKSTLSFRLRRLAKAKQASAEPSLFTAEQEAELVEKIKQLCFTTGYSRIAFTNIAHEYALQTKKLKPFLKTIKMYPEWLDSFLQKHGLSEITEQNCEDNETGFLPEEEAELAELIRKQANTSYGCVVTHARRMAYEYAVKHDIRHNFHESVQLASMSWLEGFLKRNNLIYTQRNRGSILYVIDKKDENKQRTYETLTKPVRDSGKNDKEEGPIARTASEQNAQVSGNMSHVSRTQNAQELDKLKRRLIRSVARLIKEKKTEEEVWEELKKECGKNCKTLWLRMRSLTLKKLKRLLDANDRNDLVPAVARMTLTDWLLYDLVLVHEKIDVIDRGNKGDNEVLNNLFSLVQRFEIEGRSGDDLAEAWTAATVSYNSKGLQCSPMLMQRRWFQLKELARHKLYQFWFNYRGNERLLALAKQDPPSALQRAVALRYSQIITQPFPTWEERVEKKLVIMPEEFEIKMRKKDLMKPSDEAIPDVVIVEQKIDTITLDSDSDFDNDENDKELALLNADDKESEETSQTPVIVQVKTEPEDPYENIDIVEHSVYPEKPKDRFQDAIESLEVEENRISMSHVPTTDMSEDCMMPLITNVTGAVIESTTTENVSVKNNNMEIGPANSSFINKELKNRINTFDKNTHESIVIDDDDDDGIRPTDVAQNRNNSPAINTIESNVIDITSPPAKRFRKETDIAKAIVRNAYSISDAGSNEGGPIITSIASGENQSVGVDLLDGTEDIKRENPETGPKSGVSDEFMTETDIAVDGFEFADEGIEYHEDNNCESESRVSPRTANVADKSEGNPKFDLKLLMNPVVYTTKLDKMKVYKNINLYKTINGKQLVDSIILESKPVSAKAIQVDQIKAENNKEKRGNVQIKIENSHDFDDDLFQNKLSNESNSDKSDAFSENDIKRVKLSSPMLQKPRSRSYNPIQLCKNPDFNTRLKRLNIGFFSSNRNRVFLKACKPMTIDLSKEFESKLVNGTMYLKSSYTDTKDSDSQDIENISESVASITPSAVAVQSLMDTADVDKILQTELNKRMLERNKTITLPNISIVRQINQNLLMAEVSPIVAQVNKSGREVIAALRNFETINDQKQTIIDTHAKETNEPPISDKQLSPLVTETINPSLTNPVIQTPPVVNSDHSKKGTVSNLALLPMLNTDTSNEDKTLEKQRKKCKKPLNKNRPHWSLKTGDTSKALSESLLTIDTLYKVLNALDPTSVNYVPKTKSNQYKIVQPRAGKPPKIQPVGLVDEIVKEFLQQPPTTTNLSQVNTSTKNKPISTKANKGGPASSKKQRNCCWARSKINNIIGLGPKRDNRHKCPVSNCKCCCKEILRQVEINHEIELLEKIMQSGDKCDETIEFVVQQSRNSLTQNIPEVQSPFPPKSQPTQRILNQGLDEVVLSTVPQLIPSNINLTNAYSTPQSPPRSVGLQADVCNDDNVTIMNDTENTESQINIQNVVSVPDYVAEETIDLVDDDENVSSIQTPKPKIRVHAAGETILQPLINKTHDQVNQTTQMPEMLPPTLPSPSITPTLKKPVTSRTKSKVVTVHKMTTMMSKLSSKEPESDFDDICTCRPNVVLDKQSAMLVVDGSNECPRHTTSRVSKETRIYLNRKHMSGKSRPFYVGKNKILLTNITPHKARTLPSLVALPAPLPLELPGGVQVVLLSDGSLSYVVEPDVILTRDQIMTTMPEILATIYNEIGGPGVTLPTHDFLTEETTSISSNNTLETTSPTKEVDKIENSIVNDQSSENKENTSSTLSDSMREQDGFNPDTEKTKLKDETIQKSMSQHKQESSIKDSSLSKDKENTVMDVADTENSVCPQLDSNSHNTATKTDDNNPVPDENNSIKKLESENTNNTTENENINNTTVNENINNTVNNENINSTTENENINNTTENENINNTAKNSVCSQLDSNSHGTATKPDDNNSVPDENNSGKKLESENTNNTTENENINNTTVNENINNTVNNENINSTTENENTNNNMSRNLLSALMEMSGIVEEDVNPAKQQTSTNTAPEPVQPLVIDTSQDSSSLADSNLAPLSPTAQKHVISAQVDQKLYNLNPVTSFAELKYACDNKGLFFKLDLNNGLIVPINVCIEKPPPQCSAKNTTPSEVIDLTDEQNVASDEPVSDADTPSKPPLRVYTKSNKLIFPKIKPKDFSNSSLFPMRRGRPPSSIKTIRVLKPLKNGEEEVKDNSSTTQEIPVPPSEVPTIQLQLRSTPLTSMEMQEKKMALMKRLSNNLKPMNLQQTKRSSINILNKKSLLRSNIVIPETIPKLNKRKEQIVLRDFSDDSDDEPLSNVAKKMRTGDSEGKSNAEKSQESQDEAVNDDNVDFEEVIDDVEPLFESPSNPQPVPTHLVLSGAAADQPLPTDINESFLNSFVADDNSEAEDSDDGCILGV